MQVKMAPVCVAGRLLLLQCLVFLLFLTIGTKQIESLLVCDRQSILFLRQNVRDLGAFVHDGQNTLPPLLAGSPPHLFRASALPFRRKRRHRRSGRLVKPRLRLTMDVLIESGYSQFRGPPFIPIRAAQ